MDPPTSNSPPPPPPLACPSQPPPACLSPPPPVISKGLVHRLCRLLSLMYGKIVPPPPLPRLRVKSGTTHPSLTYPIGLAVALAGQRSTASSSKVVNKITLQENFPKRGIIGDLPYDVIAHILTPFRVEELPTLMLVSRRWRTVVQEFNERRIMDLFSPIPIGRAKHRLVIKSYHPVYIKDGLLVLRKSFSRTDIIVYNPYTGYGLRTISRNFSKKVYVAFNVTTREMTILSEFERCVDGKQITMCEAIRVTERTDVPREWNEINFYPSKKNVVCGSDFHSFVRYGPAAVITTYDPVSQRTTESIFWFPQNFVPHQARYLVCDGSFGVSSWTGSGQLSVVCLDKNEGVFSWSGIKTFYIGDCLARFDNLKPFEVIGDDLWLYGKTSSQKRKLCVDTKLLKLKFNINRYGILYRPSLKILPNMSRDPSYSKSNVVLELCDQNGN